MGINVKCKLPLVISSTFFSESVVILIRSFICFSSFFFATQGYRDQIRSEEMATMVPPQLQGKEDVLFGNLNELYDFHNDVFLKDLENCISTTELVALCFVQRVSGRRGSSWRFKY